MDNEYRRAANLTVIVAGSILFIYVIFKYALGALMPFLLASLVAALIHPVSQKISKITKIPQKISATILLVITLSVTVSLLYYISARLFGELGRLVENLSNDPETVGRAIENIFAKINAFANRFGFLQKIFASEALKNLGFDIDLLLSKSLNSIASELTAYLPTAAMEIVSKIPAVLLFTAVFFISAFYFCADREKLSGAFSDILPDKWQTRLPRIRETVTRALSGYIKAYLLIMLLTFTEVFIGLSLLRVEYALLLSIIISIVDILPILGTGTVLIPWAIYAYSTGDARLATGLLIIYGIVLIVRQIAEPKIVGNSIGLHPLLTLVSIYAGIKFFGLGGIFLGPISALFIKSIVSVDTIAEEEK